MNKKGINVLSVLSYIGLALLFFYVIISALGSAQWKILGSEWVLFPSITALKQTIDYYVIVGVWIILQIAVIYMIYYSLSNINKVYKLIKYKFINLDNKLKSYITFMK
jgi:hypothetical protein